MAASFLKAVTVPTLPRGFTLGMRELLEEQISTHLHPEGPVLATLLHTLNPHPPPGSTLQHYHRQGGTLIKENKNLIN